MAIPIRVLAAARTMTSPHQFEDLGSAHRILARQLYFQKFTGIPVFFNFTEIPVFLREFPYLGV